MVLWDAFNPCSGTILIGVACALVLAGLMKGILGVGMATFALPLLSMFVDVRAAVMLLVVPLILSNIPQALEGGRTYECFKRLVPVLLGMIPGTVVGVTILMAGDPSTKKAIAGAVIMLVAALTWLAPRFQLREGLRRPVGLGTGFAGGVLGGVAAMPGPLVFTYLLAKGLRGKEFTKEASLFLVVWSALLAIALTSTATFGTADLAISAVALIPVALGMRAGRTLRALIPANVFKTAVLGIVFISGLAIVGKAIVGAP